MSKTQVERNGKKIVGVFSDEQVENKLGHTGGDKRLRTYSDVDRPKHQIPPYIPFEVVETSGGVYVKRAYDKAYSIDTEDLDIELEHIAYYEPYLNYSNRSISGMAKEKIKHHYRRAVAIISPKMANGWHRWNEYILDLFVGGDKTYRVLWGSGNCGKSATEATLLYIKWRVRPDKRMVVIVSKVVKDAGARVFGYIQGIHAKAPASKYHKFHYSTGGEKPKGIYCQVYDEKEGRWMDDERACMVTLPVKMDAKNEEAGANMMGKHPDDVLILAFDECQELPGSLLSERVFLNWLTNSNLEVHAWGNPMPVDFHNPESWDMLYLLGAKHLTLEQIKAKEKKAKETTRWTSKDTRVLHLSMYDSPKDDPDEVNCYVVMPEGTEKQRLHFLAGKDRIDAMLESGVSELSPGYYSQVLGFPFINVRGTENQGIISPIMIREAQNYPLMFRTPEAELTYIMGVDCAVSGNYDSAEIVIGRMGMMNDGRIGADVMNGRYCKKIEPRNDEEFADTTIKSMWALSEELNIPLDNIMIEVHGAGDVIRYAFRRFLEEGLRRFMESGGRENIYWGRDSAQGKNFNVLDPTAKVTSRLLFKSLGKLEPATDVVADCNTEYWVATRCAILNRQMFNIPEAVCQQGYNRYLKKTTAGTKFKIESKQEMKSRGVRSPNKYDAFVNMFELMRQKGFNFVFYNQGGFVNRFGEQYSYEQERKRTVERMGVVAGLLQMSHNFNFEDEKKSKVRNTLDLV
jgi:hypothetical protein